MPCKFEFSFKEITLNMFLLINLQCFDASCHYQAIPALPSMSAPGWHVQGGCSEANH